jgi:hypothetical protein
MTLTKFVCIFLLTLGGGWGRFGQNTGSKIEAQDARSTITGVWRGHSVCEDKNSPCHDEVNVFASRESRGVRMSFP